MNAQLDSTDLTETRPRDRVTVAIVEDDPILRQCLAAIVDQAPGLRCAGSTATLEGGIGLLDASPDVILVDLQLPDGSGLDLISRARATGSHTRLIVLTVFADVRSVVRAIEEGADGYLLKEADTDQIVSAINTVLGGGAPISPAVASHILAKVRSDGPRSSPRVTTSIVLTAKETMVLELLASGRSLKEVAARHEISIHTVGDHVKSIYRKLSVNSRSEAVFKAVQSGLIRLEP